LLGKLFTDVAGSSRYYRGGFVVYANEVKTKVLGVPAAEIERHGAVSEPVARVMADGVARTLETDYGVAVTGIAGPTGGTPAKPVGLVCFGLHTPAETRARECRFGSDAPRRAIRMRAASTALNWLRLELLQAAPGC
jgi:nicotinamide-nucleotide amidase